MLDHPAGPSHGKEQPASNGAGPSDKACEGVTGEAAGPQKGLAGAQQDREHGEKEQDQGQEAPAQGGVSPGVGDGGGLAWRRLYSRKNGWRQGFEVRELPTDLPEHPGMPMAIKGFALTTPAEAGWSLAEAGPADEILITAQDVSCTENTYASVYTVSGEERGSFGNALGKAVRRTWRIHVPNEALSSSPPLPLPSNRVVFGAMDGNLLIYRVPYETDAPPSFLGKIEPSGANDGDRTCAPCAF